MHYALEQGRIGLENQEIPVGCIFVSILPDLSYKIIARGHNQTNQTKNVTLNNSGFHAL